MRMYLKHARDKKGYTQKIVAEKIGISQNYYCDIENYVRQKELRTGMLSKLSETLNIPLEIIMEEEKKLREEGVWTN